MSRISADIKWMPLSHQCFNCIFATFEISNHVIDIPIQSTNAVTIAEALLNRLVYQFCHATLITDDDRTLSGDVLMYINDALHIRSQLMCSL